MLCCTNTATLLWCQNWAVYWMMWSTMWIYQFQGVLFCLQTLLQRFTESLWSISFFLRKPLENELYVLMMASIAGRYMTTFGAAWNFLGIEDITSGYIGNHYHLKITESTNSWGQDIACNMRWSLILICWGRMFIILQSLLSDTRE